MTAEEIAFLLQPPPPRGSGGAWLIERIREAEKAREPLYTVPRWSVQIRVAP